MSKVYITHEISQYATRIQVWDEKPERDNSGMLCGIPQLRIYLCENPTVYYRWYEFFFPDDKFPNDSLILERTVSQEEFDRFIRGEYDEKKIEVEKKRAITVVFTKRHLSAEELTELDLKEYTYYCDDPAVEVGDLIESPNYNSPVQVIKVHNTTKTDLRTFIADKINKLTTKKETSKNKSNMKKNTMVQGMIDKMKSQFIPQKEEGVKLSMDGNLCVLVNDEYIGIGKDDNLTSYPAEMCIEAPVYSITKPTKNIKVGDIIKRKNTYAKVIGIKDDGTLRCLTYSGYVNNKKEVKDFVINQAIERVLINMFNFDNTSGFNPMILMLAEGDFDAKSLMMMQMMQNQNGGNTNLFGGMNPMMFMLMDKEKDGDSSNMSDFLMMSMMMGNNNPFCQKQETNAGNSPV